MYQDSKGQPRVLAVDDDVVMRMMLGSILKDFGCEADVVRFVSDAKRCLGEREYSLIMVDGHLEDGSGLDVVRHARKDPRWGSTPIIALSADNSPEHKREMAEAGATGFLTKPVRDVDIRRLLERYALVSELSEKQ